MSNPKRIYLREWEALESTEPLPLNGHGELIEYRLVDPNEKSKLDNAWDTGELGRDEEFVKVSEPSKLKRIRAEIVEALKESKEHDHFIEFYGLHLALRIIDRIEAK